MKIARKDIILQTIQSNNILPLTSACNTSCIFCSHRFNPTDLDVYKLPKLTLGDIEDMVSFLNPGRKIIIGESATRIIEGEPFIRKDILKILSTIRNSFTKEIIEITTNGTGLDSNTVKALKSFEPIELNVSLNSASEYGRKHLQQDREPKKALDGIKLLNQNNINFHGSIVAMPMEVGYEDMYNTISFLDKNNCMTIRVLTPGFAKSASIKFDFFELRKELHSFIDKIQYEINAPILLEPPIINELEPVIEGVIRGSLADESGLKRGDIVYEVNEYAPMTRVDCFSRIYNQKNPVLKIRRMHQDVKEELKIVLSKEKHTSPGFVMLYDISQDVKGKINSIIKKNKSRKAVVLSSELGEGIMHMLLKEEVRSGLLNITTVKNDFFGGTIKSAGLLVVEDFIMAINKMKETFTPDTIIIPYKPFDYRGRDLTGRSLYDIEEKTKIKVEAI